VTTGLWTSSDVTVATAGTASGASTSVCGVAAGTATITFTSSAGCTTTKAITVNTAPGPISGVTHEAVGATNTLLEGVSGGTWTSSNPAIGSIDPTTGAVRGIAPGAITITYTIGSCYVTYPFVVDASAAGISGLSSVCVGDTTTIHDASTGGTWSSSDPTIARIGSGTGLVIGVAAGTASMTYMLPTGAYAVKTMTINPLPAAISGDPRVCVTNSTTLSDAGGGTWSSATTSVATIGSTTGI